MNAGLAVQGLSAGYPGREVLRNIGFGPIAAGSLIALVGPNAVGKSTLIKAMAGMRPCAGQVVFEGQDLQLMPPRKRRQLTGYLPQSLPQASSLLAYEIWQSALRSGRPEWTPAHGEAAIEEVVAMMGLGELALRRLDELSGGQRQMVGLAQVIVRSPRLLLLDEPTSALDLRWQILVLGALRRLTRERGTTCLVAVHDLNLASRFCDHLLALGPGGLHASGAPHDVLTPQLLREVYGITARVEPCSRGHLSVIADDAIDLFTKETHPCSEDKAA
jgi:iron complex transport system ATP-binding protein